MSRHILHVGRRIPGSRIPSPGSRRSRILARTSLAVAAFILAAGTLSPSYTQAPQPTGQQPAARSVGEGAKSVGRGWPVPVPLKPFHGYPIDEFVGSVTPWY